MPNAHMGWTPHFRKIENGLKHLRQQILSRRSKEGRPFFTLVAFADFLFQYGHEALRFAWFEVA